MTTKHLPAALLGAAATLGACQAIGPSTQAPAVALSQPLKTLSVGKAPHGIGAAAGFVYNANSQDASISVIDAGSDRVVKTLTLPDGGAPGAIASFRDGKYLLVADVKNGRLLVYAPGKEHQLLQSIEVGPKPDKIAVGEDDLHVFVSLVAQPQFVGLTFAWDRSKAPARKTFAVGAGAGESRSLGVEETWAVVPNGGDNNASLVNTETASATVLVDGNAPGPVCIGKWNGLASVALVGNSASNTLSLFPIPNGERTTLSNAGLYPSEAVADAQLGRAYFTMAGSNELAVVDYVARKLVGKVATGARPYHVLMAPLMPPTGLYGLKHATEELSHELWVANDAGDSVTVVDGENLRVKATFAVGKGHHKLAFSGTKAYVSNLAGNDISIIDRTLIQ